jgi:hypothetical protein
METFNSACRGRWWNNPTPWCLISGVKFIFSPLKCADAPAQKHRLSAAFRGSLEFVYSCGDLGEMALAALRFKGVRKIYFCSKLRGR